MKKQKCDCTHTQACEDCAKAKGIDWIVNNFICVYPVYGVYL